MGRLEDTYQFRGQTSVYVGSEDVTWSSLRPNSHHDYFYAAGLSTTPAQLGQAIVDDYANFMKSRLSGYDYTIAAVDMTALGGVSAPQTIWPPVWRRTSPSLALRSSPPVWRLCATGGRITLICMTQRKNRCTHKRCRHPDQDAGAAECDNGLCLCRAPQQLAGWFAWGFDLLPDRLQQFLQPRQLRFCGRGGQAGRNALSRWVICARERLGASAHPLHSCLSGRGRCHYTPAPVEPQASLAVFLPFIIRVR